LFARIWQTPEIGEAFQKTVNRPIFRAAIKSGNPKLPLEFVDAMYDEYDEGTRRAVLALYRATLDVGDLTESLAPALKPLARPALVLWGEKDPYLGAEYAEQQRDTFAVEGVILLEGSGHWPHAEQPQAILDAVLPFLRARVGVA
jgi:pimeloyl-ACP methyl ester carboxylesterase